MASPALSSGSYDLPATITMRSVTIGCSCCWTTTTRRPFGRVFCSKAGKRISLAGDGGGGDRQERVAEGGVPGGLGAATAPHDLGEPSQLQRDGPRLGEGLEAADPAVERAGDPAAPEQGDQDDRQDQRCRKVGVVGRVVGRAVEDAEEVTVRKLGR